MSKLRDLLFDKNFNLDKLKTPYKLLWMGCFGATMLFLYIIFGYNGPLGAAIIAGVSYYPGKLLFFSIVKILKKDIYYSQEYLDKFNRK